MGSGYSSLAEKLVEFKLKQLPFQLERLDEGQGIESQMVMKTFHHASIVGHKV